MTQPTIRLGQQDVSIHPFNRQRVQVRLTYPPVLGQSD